MPKQANIILPPKEKAEKRFQRINKRWDGQHTIDYKPHATDENTIRANIVNNLEHNQVPRSVHSNNSRGQQHELQIC